MRTAKVFYTTRISFALVWAMLTTMSLVYFVEVAGLDPLQMILIGTVLEAAVFVFEVPTGIVADLVSRRLSVIIGYTMMGVGWLITAAWPSFLPLLLAQIVWGVGYTFISGAFIAWYSGEVGREAASHDLLRSSQWAHAGTFAGIVLAVGVAQVSLAGVIWAGGVGLLLIAIFLQFNMRETQFTPARPDARLTYASMRTGFLDGWTVMRVQPVMIGLLVVAALYGGFSEGLDRLFTPLLLEMYALPAIGPLNGYVWWGILAAVSAAIGFLATGVVRRRVKLENGPVLFRVLVWLLAGIGIGVALLPWLPGLIATLAVFWLVGGLRSAYGPLLSAWLIRRVDETHKATILSMFGQADAVGQVIVGPGIGTLARALGIGAALTLSALPLVPAGWLLARLRRQVQQ